MKVLIQQPVDFVDGDILAPEDMNRVFLYAKDALDDVASKRFFKCPLPIQMVEAVDTPYTQATNVEERTQRFVSPWTCVVERAFLTCNVTSDAEVQITIVDTGGVTPSGATVPLLSTGGDQGDVEDSNGDRFLLAAGTEYKIILSAVSGNFSLPRCDVVLHLALDRWNSAGAPALPDYAPDLVTDVNTPNAVKVALNISDFATEAALLAGSLGVPVPFLITKHGLLSGTSAALRKFALPRFASARAKAKIKRIYVFAYCTAPTTVKAILRDEAGVQIGASVDAVVVATQKTTDSGALAVAFDGGTPEDTAKDYTIELQNTSGAVNCIKAAVLVWIARA